jgi:hypothetical protein
VVWFSGFVCATLARREGGGGARRGSGPGVPVVPAMATENNNGAYSISHADESHTQERALSPQITVPPHAVNLQWAGLSLSLSCCNYTVTLLINHQFCKTMASPILPSIHRN